MAIALTHVGTNTNTVGTTLAVTVPVGGVPSGATIIVVLNDGKNTVASLGTVVDTAGNTYGIMGASASPNASTLNGRAGVKYAWNATALSSGDTITFTKNANGDEAAMSVFYATGLLTASDPLDSSATATTGSSTAPSITSPTPGVSGCLGIGVVAWTIGSGSAFTQDSTHAAFATPPNQAVSSAGTSGSHARVNGGTFVQTTGAVTYAPTLGNTGPWVSFFGWFKPVSGSTFNDSVTETGTATDAPSAVATYPASDTEAATATDAPSAVATRPASDTEAATATDTPSAAVTFAASDTEAATATDAPSAVATYPASDTEAATATDTPSAIATMAVSVTETATATDAPSAAGIYPASITEAANATDTVSASDTDPANTSESATAGDATDAKVIKDQTGGRPGRRRYTKAELDAIRRVVAAARASALAEEQAIIAHKLEVRDIVRRVGTPQLSEPWTDDDYDDVSVALLIGA